MARQRLVVVTSGGWLGTGHRRLGKWSIGDNKFSSDDHHPFCQRRCVNMVFVSAKSTPTIAEGGITHRV